MLSWRIYYDSGATFSNEDGGPGDAPAAGVVAINQSTGCGHHPTETFKSGEGRLFGEDWYWWRDDIGWLQGTHDGMIDQVMHCGARFVKQGRMCGHRQWEEVWNDVASDPDFTR